MSAKRILVVVLAFIPMVIGCGAQEVEQPNQAVVSEPNVDEKSEVVSEPIEPPGKVLPEQIDPVPSL